jgi:hypothetical protein
LPNKHSRREFCATLHRALDTGARLIHDALTIPRLRRPQSGALYGGGAEINEAV